MSTKSFRHVLISFATITILLNLLTNPLASSTQLIEDTNINNESYENEFLKITFLISQNDTTVPDNTTTTTESDTDETNTTTTVEFPEWKNPFVDDNLYYPFALIFSLLGIFSSIWLVFFVETSKERTIRERIIGSAIRLVIMSIFLGLALHYWILFGPI
ncbi:MAG: hypothetical protein EAX86_08200 [Candidatus Heimdallarchaeota archaeon]|nr:hypothetical protein [Candidatus Heimdallarchaeota archaeon]